MAEPPPVTEPSGPAVTLWSLAIDSVEPDAWTEASALLDEADEERLASIAYAAERTAFVMARALLRRCLTSCFGRSASAWSLSADARGKPLVAAPAVAGLDISLSHTKGLVAVAVARAGRVGVDVERLDRRWSLDVADRYFAREEAAALRIRPDPAHFFALWTLKEAYLKAVGHGLAHGLDRVRFTLDPPRIAFAPQWPDHPARWHAQLHRVGPSHLLAAVSECGSGAPPVIDRWHFETWARTMPTHSVSHPPFPAA
jgi:4'-phosphopantetheinyl transferase